MLVGGLSAAFGVLLCEDDAYMPFVVPIEGNDGRSFEDDERTLEEMKSLFFISN